MHELAIITNLLKILNKVKKEQKGITVFLKINLTINPYSCLDEAHLNFLFRSMSEHLPEYRKTEISIKRGTDPASREFIIDNVEVETDE